MVTSGFDEMWGHVAALPGQLAASFGAGADGVPARAARRVRVCGMGGSAAAAELVGSVVDRDRIAVEVRRDYGAGPDPGPGAVFVFSSYSGHTEETLSAWEDAERRFPDRPRVVVSSGGRLTELAAAAGVPSLALPAGLPPRASLGHGIGVFCALLARLGEPGPSDQVGAAIEVLEAGNQRWGLGGPGSDSALEELAEELDGRWPILYSGCRLAHAVAGRWRAQLNENAKLLVSTAQLPELDHNEVVGWGRSTVAREEARVVALRDSSESVRVTRRFEATREVLGLGPGKWFERSSPGKIPPLARLAGLVQEGDVLSCLLARRGGLDPVPVEVIDRIKARLSEG
jgi:glucose/mannose-6-phosphate isomerase